MACTAREACFGRPRGRSGPSTGLGAAGRGLARPRALDRRSRRPASKTPFEPRRCGRPHLARSFARCRQLWLQNNARGGASGIARRPSWVACYRYRCADRTPVFGASRSLPRTPRRSLDRTDTGRSVLVAGTGLHAPNPPFTIPVALGSVGWERDRCRARPARYALERVEDRQGGVLIKPTLLRRRQSHTEDHHVLRADDLE
jgi:hypothetical protein